MALTSRRALEDENPGRRVSGPSGWVRVSMSLVIADTVIAPSLDGLYRRFPRPMDLLAAPLIRRGEVVALLQDEIDGQRVPIHALMLQERNRLPKIRACIDYG